MTDLDLGELTQRMQRNFLRGKTPIGEVDVTTSAARICANCENAEDPFQTPTSCGYQGRDLREYFGLSVAAEIPFTVDGQQVGHYCPQWRPNSEWGEYSGTFVDAKIFTRDVEKPIVPIKE